MDAKSQHPKAQAAAAKMLCVQQAALQLNADPKIPDTLIYYKTVSLAVAKAGSIISSATNGGGYDKTFRQPQGRFPDIGHLGDDNTFAEMMDDIALENSGRVNLGSAAHDNHLGDHPWGINYLQPWGNAVDPLWTPLGPQPLSPVNEDLASSVRVNSIASEPSRDRSDSGSSGHVSTDSTKSGKDNKSDSTAPSPPLESSPELPGEQGPSPSWHGAPSSNTKKRSSADLDESESSSSSKRQKMSLQDDNKGKPKDQVIDILTTKFEDIGTYNHASHGFPPGVMEITAPQNPMMFRADYTDNPSTLQQEIKEVRRRNQELKKKLAFRKQNTPGNNGNCQSWQNKTKKATGGVKATKKHVKDTKRREASRRGGLDGPQIAVTLYR